MGVLPLWTEQLTEELIGASPNPQEVGLKKKGTGASPDQKTLRNVLERR